MPRDMSEGLFLLLILKIPVVYLGIVVWWAIRAVPDPPTPEVAVLVTDTPVISPTGWTPRLRDVEGPRSRHPDRRAPRRRPPSRRVALRGHGAR